MLCALVATLTFNTISKRAADKGTLTRTQRDFTCAHDHTSNAEP